MSKTTSCKYALIYSQILLYFFLVFLLFLSITVSTIKCTVMLPSRQNVDVMTNDPFDDVYVQTILRMDRKLVTKLPILDDDIFLFNLNHSIDDMTGKLTHSDRLQISVYERIEK